MGNCQAIDAATLVVQHPSGKVDTFYWPVSANEIMKMNPGHYVALLISTTLCQTSDKENCPVKNDHNNNNSNSNSNSNQVRLTRIKLLRPTDTLVLGQVYRLITTQEVMKGLWAKKQAKMRKNHSESEEKPGSDQPETAARRSDAEDDKHVTKHERHRPRTTSSSSSSSSSSSTNSATTARSRTWQPSLKSISEATS